jgi:hypothetical protein
MPYVSDAQRRFFHSPGAAKAGLTKADVKRWDNESRGQKNLPEHVKRAAFLDELKKIAGEKRALAILPFLARRHLGPSVDEFIKKREEAVASKMDLLANNPYDSLLSRAL